MSYRRGAIQAARDDGAQTLDESAALAHLSH
jgi:hypothetical protein